MIPDEITQRFTAITLIFNPIAFIVGIMPLRALYAIARGLRGEPASFREMPRSHW